LLLTHRVPTAIRTVRLRHVLPVLVALGFGVMAGGHASGQTTPTATPTAAATVAATPGTSSATNTKAFQYSFGLWGDLPYNDEQALIGVPNLIADMNASDIEFSVHDGDLKAGSAIKDSKTPTTCSDALYEQAAGYFNALNKPAFFVPGDNDWTDCDRPANGAYNERERLDFERAKFFGTPKSFGKTTLDTIVQAGNLCLGSKGMVQCVENRRWNFKGVTYATVNIQGSCNNLCDESPDPQEWMLRNIADRIWLQQVFAAAKADNSVAVVLLTQADPGFDLSDATRTETRDPKTFAEADKDPDGFSDYLNTLRSEVMAFRKPVLYVHGDSHYFRIDKPMQDAKGQRLENFTRLETFGDNAANGNNDVHWVKVLVDTTSRDVFAYQTQMVPANRVSVPNP